MEIMFDDLNHDAQRRLLEDAGVVAPEDMNWDEIPVAVVEFEKEDGLLEGSFLDDSYDFDDDDDDMLD